MDRKKNTAPMAKMNTPSTQRERVMKNMVSSFMNNINTIRATVSSPAPKRPKNLLRWYVLWWVSRRLSFFPCLKPIKCVKLIMVDQDEDEPEARPCWNYGLNDDGIE